MAKCMRRSAVVVGVLTGATLGWVLAPVVDMTRHGTLDQQTLRAWREAGLRRPQPLRRRDEVDVPAPRRGGAGASAPAAGR